MKSTSQKNLAFIVLTFAFVFNFGCASAPYQSGLRPTQKMDQSHVEGYIQGAGDITLFQQSWHPKKKAKAVVILVHGLKDHSSRYQTAASQLANEGYAVYAYDNRGHGDSSGQRVWVDEFSEYLADLEIFYDFVKKAEPNTPIFIFGHSMGGAIVTTFALKNIRPVQGLILSAPALKRGEDVSSFLSGTTKMLGSVTPTLAVFNLKDELMSRDLDTVKAGKEDPLIYHGNAPARTAKEVLKAIEYIQEHMSELSVPFLALHGEKDVITNPEGSKELYQKAKSTDKTLKLYPALYHDLLHEPERQQVYTDILHWLNTETNKLQK